MAAAFEAGGSVVGVLPEGVERRIRESTTRQAIADGLVVVVSPYHPAAGFSAGAAMARNKLIYALSDAAVVISSASGSGGTWEGAVQALDHDWVPVLVRSDAGVPAGNVELIARGARPIDLSSIGEAADAETLLERGRPVGRPRRRVARAVRAAGPVAGRLRALTGPFLCRNPSRS